MPAPVVDLEPGRDERLRHRSLGDLFLLAIGGNGLVLDEAAAVLGADSVLLEEFERGRRNRAQDFYLLVADRLGIERGRRFHRGEGEKLEHVVLHHVARRAGVVVITAAALDAHLLGHRDLHVVDVEPVPERLINGIGKAEINQILHRLLAEIMVDAEDILFRKSALERAVEFFRALEIGPERLLDDEPPALAVLGLAGQSRGGEVLGCFAEIIGSSGEIEEVIFADRRAFRQGLELFREPFVGLGIVEFALEVIDVGRELFPHFLIDRLGVGELLKRVAEVFPEFLVALRPAGEPDDGEVVRQQPVFGQVIKGRDDFAMGEVARGAEDDRRRRLNFRLRAGDHRRTRRFGNDDGHGVGRGEGG